MLRSLKTLLLAALLLLVLAAAALWGWSSTPESLHWALARFGAPQGLTAEGVTGSLRTGLRANRLVLQQPGLRAELEQVDVAWRPLALLHGTLRLLHVRAAQVRVEDTRPPNESPKRAPQSLSLPLKVTMDELTIGQLEWSGSATFSASELSARYAYDGLRHELALNKLRWADGSYRGHAGLGARGSLPLDAMLEADVQTSIPGSTQTLALRLNARATGPLANLQARLQLQGSDAAAATMPAATVTARLTPWAEMPVAQGDAELRGVDLAALWPEAPQTALSGHLRLAPAGTATWRLQADLANGSPGPWDQGQLPVVALTARADWHTGGRAVVHSLEAQLGGGQLRGQGEWLGAQQGWRGEARVQAVNPAALYSELAPLPLSGQAQAQAGGEAVQFTVNLQAAAQRPLSAPARSQLAGTLQTLALRQLQATGQWDGDLLTLMRLNLRTQDASLRGNLSVRPAARTGSGQLDLRAPGLQASVNGSLSAKRGRGTLQLASQQLDRASAWLRRLPAMPPAVRELALQGQADLQVAWQGGWEDPTVQARLAVPQLQWGQGSEAWSVRELRAEVDGRLQDARIALAARAQQGQRQLRTDLAGRVGRTGRAEAPVWQTRIASLAVNAADPSLAPGTWTVALRQPVSAQWASGRLETSGGEAVLTAPVRSGPAQAVLAWQPVRWGGGQAVTVGRLSGLPLSWIELFSGAQLAGALTGDLVFDAEWEARLGDTPRIRAVLARSRGDLMVRADTAHGGSTRIAAGLREARLSLQTEGDALALTLRWYSERAGTVEGRLTSCLARGGAAGWQWPADAPLAGTLRAQLPRVGVWSLLAPPGWRLRGSLEADLRVAGTRADPQLGGELRADDLGLRSVVDGIELQGGRLRARLDGQRLLVDEFLLRGAGPPGTGGTLTASGEGGWIDSAPQLRMTARLDRLRASLRPDWQLTVSGQVAARVDTTGTDISGRLRINQARIVLPEETAPRLGDDVVVRNAPALGRGPEARGTTGTRTTESTDSPGRGPSRPVKLAVTVDLGDDFRVQGRGITTRLAGELLLAGNSLTDPQLTGVIRTVDGEYRAYGQRLDIERGVLRFTGPLANPALDILAVRPRLVQRVGVQVTGRAQAPYVRLYAEPELSEAEKLSWLVLGRPAASGGAEAALLQQAALALLAARGGASDGKGIAGRLGLDELSVRRDGDSGAAVTLGKRLARNLYATYESSLSGALGTLYVFYELSQRLTVRAEAGERTGVDLIYTFSFD